MGFSEYSEERWTLCAWDRLGHAAVLLPESSGVSGPGRGRTSEIAKDGDLIQVYDYVTEGLDRLLAGYGYVWENLYYRAEKPNTDTITFFCHFGLTCVLLNVSPFVLWHGLVLAPAFVTEVITEEREQGIAIFRGQRFGDVHHLLAGGRTPSFSARFCEIYDNMEQRH